MALVTANQFQLAPDISRLGTGFAQGQQIGSQIELGRQQRAQALQQQQSQQFAGQALTGQQGAIENLAAVDAQRATQIQSFLANQSEADRAEGLRENEVLTRTAFAALSIEDPIQRRAFLTAEREKFAADNRSTTNIDNALAGDDAALNQMLNLQAQQGQTIADLAERQFPKAAKLSSLQQKVAAEGLDPNTPAGQARAREITQGTRTDPSLKPSDQQLLNKATEGQLTSSVFANRVFESNEIINNLEDIEGFNPASITSAILQSFPGGNIALSDEQQQYIQAKRDIISAVLRKQSGAVIGESEFENEDKKLFPQVGDSAVVKAQKRRARNREFESLKAQSKGVFGAQFGKKSDPTSKPPASIARPTPGVTATPPAAQELTEGIIIVNPQTGQRLQLVNGQFVEVQ